MIVVGTLRPSAVCHDQPFDNSTATDSHNLDVYDIAGTVGVNSGNPLAHIVQDSCFEQNAAIHADANLWHKTALRGDDMVARFTVGPGGVAFGSWFSNLMLRSDGAGQQNYVYANFRSGSCYLGRFINGAGPSDWASNTGVPNMDAGDVVELSAVGLKYYVVYENAGSPPTRTTVCTFNDAAEGYVRSASKRRAGMRIGYSGANSPWCDRWQFYDLPVWPLHAGLAKSGSYAYTSGWTAPTSWSVTGGYPATVASGASGVQMLGAGTASAWVCRATTGAATGTSRVKVNGSVVWTGNQTTTASVVEQTSEFVVALGDVVSVEFTFTSAATISTATYLNVVPSAASIPVGVNP